MYKRECPGQLKIEIPFNVELNPDSKWIRIADKIPWEQIEDEYVKHIKGVEGQRAKPSRLAFGALFVQASECLTDEKTREYIQENPHIQYFCGYAEYTPTPPFDASMMVHFRKRIPAETVMKITETAFAGDALIGMDAPEVKAPDGYETDRGEDSGSELEATSAEPTADNRGTLILDATCCPQDIRYPTDIGLMNNARELCEEIIDRLYETVTDRYDYKPRTYRNVARRDYLAYTKIRKHTAKTIRRHLRKQINYVGRDLRIIEDLVGKGAPLSALPWQLYRKLLVINEAYRQQKEMYDTKTHRCEARIVSISQPHVRPIVRGKEHDPVEFGSKTAIGLVGGYAFITDISWENIAEASLLPQAAEQYKSMFGFYPKSIIGDGVYPNLGNRTWCRERSIRLSGPALGRKSEEDKQEERKQRRKDGCERNAVEGEFGITKRKLGLDRIMTKLSDTSLTAVAMGFFVANMERKLRSIFSPETFYYVFYDFYRFRLVILGKSA